MCMFDGTIHASFADEIVIQSLWTLIAPVFEADKKSSLMVYLNNTSVFFPNIKLAVLF